MDVPYDTAQRNGEVANNGLQIIRYPSYQQYQNNSKLSSSWFDLRVFYVQISNFKVDESTPKFLTLNHIPLCPDTLLEVNGARTSMYADGVSSHLRRDRVDKKSEKVTFVNTDSIRFTGSVKFNVFDKDDHILSGVLDMSTSNGYVAELKNSPKRWSMSCESEITSGTGFLKGKQLNGTGFLKGKQLNGTESPAPSIEVYVAGSFSGSPIILTKTLQIAFRKKHNRKSTLDAIPEYETTELPNDDPAELDMEVAEYRNYKPENEEYGMYWRTEYEGEDGELSWFNAGVRVGVGIGLGICLGVGIGVGLLVRTYQTTTRTFKRQL